MDIVFDFEDIARRVNRKSAPDAKPVPAVAIVSSQQAEAQAAIFTLKSLGYTYSEGARMWKPPIGKSAEAVSDYGQFRKELLRNTIRENLFSPYIGCNLAKALSAADGNG